MTLSVRFSPSLQEKLVDYCAATGATKSMVLQEAVTEYLARQQVKPALKASASRAAAGGSKTYQAFARAGLIGALKDGAPDYLPKGGLHQSATNEVVRNVIRDAITRRSAAQR